MPLDISDPEFPDPDRYNVYMRRTGLVVLATAAMLFAYLAYVYLSLPDVRPLRTTLPRTTAFIELRASEAREKGQTPRRDQRWIAYDRMSPSLKRAVIVAEDSRFWEHEGIDVDEIEKSIETNWARGEFVRGASTITQQLAKNLYLSPSKNPFRKLRELLITRRLEAELSKRRILELYLNEIEWGDGVYGAEAAARRYFRTSASALGPEQSALLAAAIVNPHVLNPARPTRRLLNRQRLIRRRMRGVTPPESSRPAALDPTPEAARRDAPVFEPPAGETHELGPDGDAPQESPDRPDRREEPAPEDIAPLEPAPARGPGSPR
jgi:monofunctional biosynthetic peptidoglycan transglycosylase